MSKSATPPMSAADIRSSFVEFFIERGHTHVPSASLVPENDPTLLFVNAGMNQFKDVFTGREQRAYRRAVTVQRCLRAGGKHNDLDNVGFTPRHQTMFEMLGNFSFGDYFKKEAIAWAWAFLVEELGLPQERLVATVYDGTGESAKADDEAFELWRTYLPDSRIYRCSAKDNFWQMGDTGPCGPCSEIHLCADPIAPPDAGVAQRGPAYEDQRYLELWNLVFMQYEKHADGSMSALPKPSIDTGAGLERLAAAVAGVSSNYETDLLSPLVAKAKQLSGGFAGKGDPPYRVMADHARATAFLIADGVFPDRDGRSYVLRRIMRRAIRHGTEVGLDAPFFHELCLEVVERFGAVYPVLRERQSTIDEVVRTEEEGFRRTLDRGLRRLRDALDEASTGPSFDPAIAADLYDTYGFPLDLTATIVAEHGRTLDEDAARQALEARQGGGGRGAKLGADQAVADHYYAVHAEVGDTIFEGYDQLEVQSRVLAVLQDGTSRPQATQGTEAEVVVAATPMYPEGGGQVGDRGRWSSGEVSAGVVVDTFRPLPGLIVHRVQIESGTLCVGQDVVLRVDAQRRQAIRRNHSATHLLHLALREVLGDHVVQKGSFVDDERLRFDFSHPRALTSEERLAIERSVNERALANAMTETQPMSPAEAKAAGAIGLFDTKYGESVRVVRIGGHSLELCGGTHVARAGEIGLVAILSEAGVAQGVRRIEAVTGLGALAHLQRLRSITHDVMSMLHAADHEAIVSTLARIQSDAKLKDSKLMELQRQLATGSDARDDIQEVRGTRLLVRRVPVGDAKALRAAADTLRDKLRSGVVVLGAADDGKATLLVAVTPDLKERVHAGKLVGALATHVGGRGGGRADFAQAGGPRVEGLDAALQAASAALEEQLTGS